MRATVSLWNGRPSPLVRPRLLRMSAISVWVWWPSRSSTAATTWGGVFRSSQAGLRVGRVRVWFWPPGSRTWQVMVSAVLVTVRRARVVEDGGEIGDQLADAGLLRVGERPGGGVGGLVVGVLGVAVSAEGVVPVGFEGVGDQPVGGVDGEVAAAGQVGVVAGTFDGGGAELIGLVCSVFEFGGDGERGFDGQWGEGVDEQRPDGGVDARAGDGLAVRPTVFDLVVLADVGG